MSSPCLIKIGHCEINCHSHMGKSLIGIAWSVWPVGMSVETDLIVLYSTEEDSLM